MLYPQFTDADLERFQPAGRYITNISHLGTKNFEFTIKTEEGSETAKEVIKIAFENIGE